nr:uncharacterized protein LOC127347297 [Lolium perenne]
MVRPPPPPPPPPPEMGQAMLQMTQLLAQMQQHQHNVDQANRQGNGRVMIRDFLQLNPRSFDATPQPLDADDWVRDVNRMLNIAGVAPEDKVKYATHLLKGGSAAWWDHYQEMRGGADVSWDQFVEAFRSHHISDGIMERMKEKFCQLVQGNNDVITYSSQFTDLARYAGDEVPTDAKKQKRFRSGLKPSLRYALTHVPARTFDELVNNAVKEETGRLAFEESRKHSRDVGGPSAPTPKRRLWVPYPTTPGAYHMPAGYAPHPPVLRPPAPRPAFRVSQPLPRPPLPGPPRPPAPRPGITCYKCGQAGHISTFCTQKLPPPPPRSTPTHAMVRAPASTRAFHPSTKSGPRAAHLHNISIEQAEQATDVVLGTLPVNSSHASVLFDTGASLSFVSQKFSQKQLLPMESLPQSFSVVSPGGQMIASKISHA